MKADVYKEVNLGGILPVVVLDDSKHALPLAKALLAGGIRQAEITFRTDAAEEAIRAISAGCPEMLVGAGTVTSVDIAKKAVRAGARFIVSPGFDPEVVSWCLAEDVPVFPGVATGSEVQAAVKLGLDHVKIYPAELLGGAEYIQSLSSVFPGLSFLPSGGIDNDNLCDYLDLDCVAAASGSWVCPRGMITAGRFEEIEALARAAVLKMHNFFLLHIGVNTKDAEDARSIAGEFAEMFEVDFSELPASFFAGTMMEIVKGPFLGEHGHIAISTNYVERAMAYFEHRGYKFRPNPATDQKGILAPYFEGEVGGYAIHLRRKL